MKIEFDDIRGLGSLCICSVRYALGRRTYMPSVVAGQIAAVADKLDLIDIDVMIRDIENPYGGYGDPCDEVIWKWLLEELKKRRSEKAPTKEA